MFAKFLSFELRFWLRGMMVYVFLFIIGLLIFGATSSDNVRVGASSDSGYRNSPYAIQNFYAVASLLTALMITAFVNAAAVRDFTYQTHELLFTKPLSKPAYLMGRFWGSVTVSIIPMLGVSLGVIVASWMPWMDADRLGKISWGAHFWGIIVFAIPNAILIAAIVFAIAAWTRSSMASFIGILVLLIGYSISQSMVRNLDNESIAMLLDPFGIRAFMLTTKYWTVAEQNSRFVTLSGGLLWNRLLWFAVSMFILALACWRFSFAERRRMGKSAVMTMQCEPTSKIDRLPTATLNDRWTAQVRQLVNQFQVDFVGILKSNVFIVVMLAGLLNTIAALLLSTSAGFGLKSMPVTYEIVDIIRGAMYIFLLAVIVFYAGVLVWKERDAGLNDVYDALPHPTWIVFTAKLLSLVAVVILVLVVSMFAGVAVQAMKGYTRFQIGLYLRELFVIDLIELFCLLVLAMIVHVLSPNKYFGYFAFIVLVLLNSFVWGLLHIETRMVQYGELPGHVYSDLYGYAPFVPGLTWFSLYWLLFAGLLLVAAVLLWQRGRETSFRSRFAALSERWRGFLRPLSVLLLIAWISCAGWVYRNTKMINKFKTSHQMTALQADYEKKFKQYEEVPQPRVTRIIYDIELYPESRSIELRGQQTLVNKSDSPIEQLFLNTTDGYDTQIEVKGAELHESFPDFDYFVYKFDPPLAVGGSTEMSFTVGYQAEGFENSVRRRDIVQNGTFFNNSICPQIGYQPNAELTDKHDRKKHGLGEPRPMPLLDPRNLQARGNTYISNSSDWVEVETTISTSADQIAIAPGSLVNAWEENGRRYFHYKVDHPSLNFYSFISARYEVATNHWKHVDIEVYYHPDHKWNVENMLRSIRKSLEYYTENFGPYYHKQARIIEFPRVASFAQAFPGTMPYSEGIGFIADIKDNDDIDMVFYVVAHEMAHQWWAHQVIGSNMQGATLLSETLAQYSALMVMEKEFGRDMMRKFLAYEMDNYLRSRGSETLKEQPLLTVEANQGYVHYRKGSVVMYYLREMIGEERVNAALRELLAEFGYAGPPYPTSQDLVNALKKQTPEEYQYLLADLFEKITLFENRTLAATYSERPDGKFDVQLEVEIKKMQADEEGQQTEVPADDWIEVGALSKPAKGKKYGGTLHRERLKMISGKHTFAFVVDEVPDKVGVDPFSLLIDRIPDDNVKRPKQATAAPVDTGG